MKQALFRVLSLKKDITSDSIRSAVGESAMKLLVSKNGSHVPSPSLVDEFDRQERVRELFRSADTEEEMSRCISEARECGIIFEAQLGERKLDKLKVKYCD